MTWRSGKDIYKGFWHNDQRVKGMMQIFDGTTYDGEWKNDVFHGKGMLTFKNQKKDEKGVVF